MFLSDVLRLMWIGAFVLFVSIAMNVAMWFRFVYVRPTPRRAFLAKLGLLLGTLLLIFFILELSFSFIVMSDGFDGSLASKLWFHKYWHPINSLGYRDREHTATDKRLLFIVGDSIVAGHGVNDPGDRFGDRLGRTISNDWETIIIANNGWDTGVELQAVKAYPARPALIVLSYFPNDIDATAMKAGRKPQIFSRQRWAITNFVVSRSFFLNWVYWKVYRSTLGDEYWQWLVNNYNDPAIWSDHLKQIEAFKDYALVHHAKLSVVIWPNLAAVSASRPITSKVSAVLRAADVPVLDLTDTFEGRKVSDLVVNSVDAHPNANIHGEVAQKLRVFLDEHALVK